MALQRQAVDRFNKNKLALLSTGSSNVDLGGGVKNFTFSNPAASGERLGWEGRVVPVVGWLC